MTYVKNLPLDVELKTLVENSGHLGASRSPFAIHVDQKSLFLQSLSFKHICVFSLISKCKIPGGHITGLAGKKSCSTWIAS